MADKKEFVTSLVVEADDTQVAKLRDTLQQVAGIIQGIQAQGPIGRGGAAGGSGAGGAGGGGGWGPGGSGSGGPSGWGGGQSGGGGGGGGGPPGQGGNGPPEKWAGKFSGAIGQIAAHEDEGVLVAGASAAGSAIPWFGAGLGLAAGALMSSAISRGRMAIEFDRQRAVTAGLLRGSAPDEKSGADMGYDPAETQSLVQGLARESGLSGDQLMGSRGRIGASSLMGTAMQADRAGIGGVGSFLDMFRPGGGGALGFAPGNAGISDETRMQAALSAAISSAFRAGLQNSDVEKYLGKIQGAVGAMADKGVQVDPLLLIANADQLAHRSGREHANPADMAAEVRMFSIGQEVARGGGTPFQQYLYRRAAGFGRGVGFVQSSMALESGIPDDDVIAELKTYTGGTETGRLAVAQKYANDVGMSVTQLYEKLGGEPKKSSLLDMVAEGSQKLAGFGGAGVTPTMKRTARLAAEDTAAGEKMKDVILDAREALHSVTNEHTSDVADVVKWVMDKLGGGGATDAVKDQAEKAKRVLEKHHSHSGGPLGDAAHEIQKAEKRAIDAAKRARPHPDPKKGGTYIEIRPAPGMERFFHFGWGGGELDGSGVPG